jgi:tetratricopeptide (TPR) repeat protein
MQQYQTVLDMNFTKVVLVFIIGIFAFQNSAIAQPDDEYNDLLFLLVDGKYDKLLYKSMGYIEDDETRRDPLPYLYTSMCYYEMSQLEEYDEEFPRAFKDAVKYCVKYRKKDESGFYVAQNEEYIDKLKLQTFEEADNYFQLGKVSKAKSYFKYLVGMDPNDWGAWLLKGVSEAQLNMTSDAKISLETAVKGLENTESIDNYWEGQRLLLKEGLIYYSNYLVENGKVSEAKELMALGYTFLQEDNEYKIAYDEVMRA